ncbi:hypothetical protein LDO32_11025 [Luteimonas sp. Y-2-2-4F]|nr:contact-dependent growth inhibition system immunity protein [Luteimonas sp. Y-2-2-4F]MCD9032256.1 hypothetical protein [Luteimonas sp. Y-2-2-4F]
MSDYPTLENLFAAYFHQDWAAEHATADAVIDYYRGAESADQVEAAREELDRLLAQDYDEHALAQLARGLGSEYDPTREGRSWRDWLESLRQRLTPRPRPAPR